MSTDKPTTNNKKWRDQYKNIRQSEICQVLSCDRKAIYKISVSAGIYGHLPLLVCKQCFKLFDHNNNNTI
ncbi:MAG TPA: hypothetical protein VFG45_11180 [Candidatus Nitrosocosmicus sp.]|nr:hypothetical protein [Candidatus Nitrosocosmicus sp.]